MKIILRIFKPDTGESFVMLPSLLQIGDIFRSRLAENWAFVRKKVNAAPPPLGRPQAPP